MVLKELCLNVHTALVEQELKNKCYLLVKDSHMSADKGKCLKESNEQVCPKMIQLKYDVCQLHFKCNKLVCENKCLTRKTKC